MEKATYVLSRMGYERGMYIENAHTNIHMNGKPIQISEESPPRMFEFVQ